MNKEIIILLTGTINVGNKHFTTLLDSNERAEQYIDTIKYYLNKTRLKIVFSENSGTDISQLFREEVDTGRIEFITHNGNDYNQELGKGRGEMNCIEYAINNSSIITENSFVFKITGRYRILNLNKFIEQFNYDPQIEILVDLTKELQFSSSAIFGFTQNFFKKYLIHQKAKLNDSKNYFFEHGLANAIINAIGDGTKFHLFKYYPRISAVSGTTGSKYPSSLFYYIPRYLKYRIRDFILKR